MNARILLVDDEKDILSSLSFLFKRAGYDVLTARNGKVALTLMESENVDVVISDLNMPLMDGTALLSQIARDYPESIRLVLSGYMELDQVMQSVNQGRVWGYINKPWDNQALLFTVKQALETRNITRERDNLRRTVNRITIDSRTNFAGFVGQSTVMQFVYKAIEKSARSKASVMLTGPSGAGKEVAAEAIHQHSPLHDKPFNVVNCAAIPSELMESELFGHVKGAFSGAVSARDGLVATSDGGTLFLDELTEMDISLQAKLLRFIQTGKFKRVGSDREEQAQIRFVSATNRDPQTAIAENKLREDLYYRLNVISIDLPPLAEREGDKVLLAEHFLKVACEKEGRELMALTDNAKQLIEHAPWPGNVRQLQNIIYSASVMADGDTVDESDIQLALGSGAEKIRLVSQAASPIQETTQNRDGPVRSLAEIERSAIENTIKRFNDNVVQSASALGVSPSTLYRKMQQWEENAG